MKLIVSDMDGTLLNSQREISAENAAALQAAQEKGIEIAIATGRTYGSALAICREAGLKPHIISNHGAFVYAKTGERLMARNIDARHVKHALQWLNDNNYFYNLCTDTQVYVPANMETILKQDFAEAVNIIPEATTERLQEIMWIYQTMPGCTLVNSSEEIFAQEVTFGSISSITFDQDKLQRGREHFAGYEGLSMTVAGRDIFEMINTSVSKGNAVEYLAKYLQISLQEVMAIGDNYNDISMLEKVGVSVAIGNAEEEVKQICKHVSLSNDHDGVAYIVKKMLAGFSAGKALPQLG